MTNTSQEKIIDQPIKIIIVTDQKENDHRFLGKSIPTSGHKAYLLVDDQGNEAPKTFQITENKHIHIIQFNGLWVEKNEGSGQYEVTSLNLLTKDKLIDIGFLKSISPL